MVDDYWTQQEREAQDRHLTEAAFAYLAHPHTFTFADASEGSELLNRVKLLRYTARKHPLQRRRSYTHTHSTLTFIDIIPY